MPCRTSGTISRRSTEWPTLFPVGRALLVNGIESELIPTTNNVVELVNRRFDQHHQNFCGFDNIETLAASN